MSAADLRSIRRRFYLLLALRFVPTGLFVTVFVLLLRDRGLTLAEIGIGTAMQGVVMLFLELPSGGLADALGRKPVLMVATPVSIAAVGLLLVTDTVVLLAVCTPASRASSVPSTADRSRRGSSTRPWSPTRDVDIERGLARQNIVICSSIGLGALLSSGIVAIDGFFGIDAARRAARARPRRCRSSAWSRSSRSWTRCGQGQGWDAAARLDRPGADRRARRGASIIRRSSLLTALVIGELLWGFGMVAFETFMPPRMAEVSGGVEEAARLLGPADHRRVGAVGRSAPPRAPWLVRRYGSGVAGLCLRLAHGATVVGMGLAAGPAGLVVAYLATYWVHGATAPVHYGMVHRAVDSGHRATVVSANSLTSQVGGAAQRHRARRAGRRHQHQHRHVRRRRRARGGRAALPRRPRTATAAEVDAEVTLDGVA